MSERWYFEGWGVLFLSLALVIVTGIAVANTGWADGLNVIPMVNLGAFLIGLMIAKSRLPGWLGHLFSVIIGFAWSFRLVATLFPAHYTWPYRWAWLWWYVYQWTYKLVTGGVSYDNMIFILQMAVMGWLVTYLTVWFIFRARKAWHAIIPGGVLLVANLSYAPKDITFHFLAYLFLALLLVIRFNLFTQGQTWRRERVHFNADEVNFDFLRSGTLFTVLIVVLAWITPTVAATEQAGLFDVVQRPWRHLQGEWNRLFASLNYRPASISDFYGKALTLGGPRELSETPVLEVKAPPGVYYWRAVVFDEFTGREWRNNDDTRVPFGADNEALSLITYQAQQTITHTVTVLQPGTSVLVMVAQPIWVSQPAWANLSYVNAAVSGTTGSPDRPPAAAQSQVETISYAQSRVLFEAGDHYTVTSMLTRAPVRQLQQAGVNYPAWIRNRYLQLPDTLPNRVKQLAQEIAAPYENPYDQAAAIESFLRREITYNEKSNAPPPDRDPVDYVLFESKQGYCDYYATAMVVMLRSLGIPSRPVSGYAQGNYDYDTRAYTVLQRDAHTWVEVFFPDYGWIEFEPTAAQPAITRPTDPSETNLEEESDRIRNMPPGGYDQYLEQLRRQQAGNINAGDTPLWTRLNVNKPTAWIGGGLVLLIIAGIATWAVRNRRMVQMSQVELVYTNMLRLAGWAGASIRLAHTPYEHASALGQVVPAGERPAQRIAGLYTGERYGHKPLGIRGRADINHAWRTLRPLLTRAILLRWLGRRNRQ